MKFKLLLLFVMVLLVPYAVQASALTDSLQDKIEFWWQGFNGEDQVIENVQNNNANMTKATTGTLPVGRDYAAFSSHNDSTEYFEVTTSDTISSYGNFSIENIKDDTEGGWCFSGNHTLPVGLSGTIVSLSQPDAGANKKNAIVAIESTGTYRLAIQDAAPLGTVSLDFGTPVAGQKTFLCFGNTGERFWAYQDGINVTITETAGSIDSRIWYANGSAYTTGLFGATQDFAFRFRDDEFTLQMDLMIYLNGTPTTEELNELWNGTTLGSDPLNFSNVFAAVVPGLKEFTLTAKDVYDGIAITNITVSISNSSFSFNASTVNGTLILNNISIPSFNQFYDIEFRSNDTGGYFNRTFLNVNISDTNSFEGTLFQSVLKLFAIDGLNNNTISDFTAVTNLSSDSTTNGQILILIKEGTFQLNVTALGFDKLVTNFSITSLANNSLNVTLGSVFTFRLIREETNTPFNFNLTNSTDLTIFCPNETIRITFNTSNNISQIINCQFELMQMTVDYGILGSYFRTLIPPFSQKNITWYLIDLIAGDTAIQKVIQLVDLTGEFNQAILRVRRAIPGESLLKIMIEQKFDISNEVNLFLVKDALYTLNIENDFEDIALGNLIPTEAGTQTITLPKIDFVPQETTLGDDISWAYTFNVTLGILRLQYVDTTNLTTLVRFTVKNGSSPTLNQLFLAESDNNSTVTMTFNQVLANNTYVTELFFIHPGLINFTETRPWYEFGGTFGALNLEGWSPQEQISFKNWASWIFLAVWGMLWSRRYIGIGMTTLIIWLWIFKTLIWIVLLCLCCFNFCSPLVLCRYIEAVYP